MTNYTQTTFFTPKDTLPATDPNKTIFGAAYDVEFGNISTAIATKPDSTTVASHLNVNVTGNGLPANGIYLPAANTLGFTANSTLYVTLASGGVFQRFDGLASFFDVGYLDSPLNSQNAGYTLVLTDRGKSINKSSGSAATWIIPANSSVAFPIGTTIVLSTANGTANVTLSISTDTLYWAPTGATGSRTLAANSLVTLYKNTATTWQLAGVGIT